MDTSYIREDLDTRYTKKHRLIGLKSSHWDLKTVTLGANSGVSTCIAVPEDKQSVYTYINLGSTMPVVFLEESGSQAFCKFCRQYVISR